MKQKPIQFFLRCHDFHTSNSLCICGKGLFVEPVDLEYICVLVPLLVSCHQLEMVCPIEHVCPYM